MSDIAAPLARWHRRHGRHDLPWQNTCDPYRVWLSEIMLQQTQVATVLPYYARFLDRFPTLDALAQANVEAVMPLWSGLGYYARARNAHRCAQTLLREHGGQWPRSPEGLAALPGIGQSTANAIATFCFGARAPILDGNVKRVFCRYFGVEGDPASAAVGRALWALAQAQMPANEAAQHNQALMDLGALLCTRSSPGCRQCPLTEGCVAHASGRVAQLPQRREKAALPERHVSMLAITDAQGRVMLEQRPAAGIWGGLCSLPELPAGQSAALWLQQQLGVAPSAVSPKVSFVHTFTHFRLHITPLHCRIGTPQHLAEPRWLWYAREEALAAALPAPVRRIVQALAFPHN